MDDAVVQRFERYFELIQAQLVGMQAQQARVLDQLTSMQDQLVGMRGEIGDVKAELKAHRVETAERFQSVHDQLSTFSQHARQFETRTEQELVSIRAALPLLTERMKALENGMFALNGRIDVLSDDMRQRFRAVNDRLTGIEKRDAA